MDLPQFDYFLKPVFQKTVDRDVVTEQRPSTLVNSENSLVFEFNLAENEYLLFNESYLYVRAKVILAKGTDEIKKDHFKKITPANYLLNTMFRQANVEIDGYPVCNTAVNFMYKAHLEALLAYSEDAKTSHLTAALWEPEDDERSKRLREGGEFEMMGRIHFDLTHQMRAFPGGHKVKISLELNKPAFLFTSTETGLTASIKFSNAHLDIRRAILSSQALKEIKHKCLKNPICLPLVRSRVRAFPIPKDSVDLPFEDVTRGALPRRIFFTMVKSEAYNGSFGHDAFNYEHFNLNYLACYIDGVQYPSRAYTPDFTNDHYAREYIGLIQALNQNNTDSYANISYEDFKNTPIFGFNFTPDLTNGDILGPLNPPKQGTLRFQVAFKEALTVPVTALVYMEFDSNISIEQNNIKCLN